MRYNSSIYPGLTDEELIQRVRTGDEAAFAQLAARHSSQIWRLVRSNSRQTRDAEEIFQDIWVAVWENIGSLREVKSFEAWLRKIAYTTCRRYYAAQARPEGEILQSPEKLAETIDRDALAHFRGIELHAAVREAVYHLPEGIRPVGVLYYLEMWTVKEIADELNLAVGTVKTRLSQIRTHLRAEFGVEVVERRKTMSLERSTSTPSRQKIKVFGIGDAGGNVVKRMIASSLKGVELYSVNTDLEALGTCDGATQVPIGAATTQGVGAGGNPRVGKRAAEESLEGLATPLSDAHAVFVIAGMGGGTGTGAAPLVAALARESGALTIGVVTLPFDFEGQHRAEQAEHGLQELRRNADGVIVVPSQRLLDSIDVDLSTNDAFQVSDETVLLGVKTIFDIVVDSGEVSVGLSDIREIMQNTETILLGIGTAKGRKRAQIAAKNAISSPLLSGRKIGSATGLIVNISAPSDFEMSELDAAMAVFKREALDAQIIFGLVYRDTLEPEDAVIITVLVAGVETQTGPVTPSSAQRRGSSPGDGTYVAPAANSGFGHLHNHSESSLLDGACRMPDMA